MSVQEVSRRAGPFEGDGSTKEFSFHFKVFNADNVAVYVSDEDDGDVQLTQGYTVELNADQDALPGGTVILTDPLPEGQRLSILSCVPYDQPMVLTNQGGFYPRTINDSADRLAIQVQQLLEEMKRTLKVPATSSMTPWGLLLQIFQAAESAATSAEEAEKYAQICEEIKEYVEVYSWDIPHLVDSIRDVENFPYDGLFVVGGYGNAGGNGQNISNRYVKAEGSTELRTLGERFADIVNVKDFGAKGDGVTDDTAACLSMADAVGYVRFPRGKFALGTVEFDCPAYFDAGSELYAAAGSTVIFRGEINAPRQYIFKGEGSYNLGNDSDSGEQARAVHVSWFGAFPSAADSSVDCAPFIQRAMDSVDRSERESVIQFDIGRYVIGSEVHPGRACHVLGSGTRKTVFVYTGGDYVMFNAQETGSRFSHFQIEPNEFSGTNLRSQPCIVLNGDNSQILDAVLHVNASNIVDVQEGAAFSTIRDIRVVTEAAAGIIDGTAIQIRARGCIVQNITYDGGSTKGYEHLVDILGSETQFVSNVTVENVISIIPRTAVRIKNDSTSRNVNSVYVHNVQINATEASDYPAVLIENNAAGIYYVHVDHVFVNQSPTGVKVSNKGSGNVLDIHLDNVCSFQEGNAIILERTGAGILGQVTLGSGNDRTRGTPKIGIIGEVSDVYDAGMIPVGNISPSCYGITVEPESAVTIALGRNAYSGIAIIGANVSTIRGVFSFRAASSPFVQAVVSEGISTATGVLSGTTGASGAITLSANPGVLYLENRTASSRVFTVCVMSGDE